MGATRALLPPQNHRVTARSQARFQLPAEAEGHALPLPDFQAHLRPQQNGQKRGGEAGSETGDTGPAGSARAVALREALEAPVAAP